MSMCAKCRKECRHRRIPQDQKVVFLTKYNTLAVTIFSELITQPELADSVIAAGKELVRHARKELGYSETTYSEDILTSLRRVWANGR